MSQIASFSLLNRRGTRKELPDGGLSGEVYTAILSYFEDDLEIDCRINAPAETVALDCAMIDLALAEELLEILKSDASVLADGIAGEWELPADLVGVGLKTFRGHLQQVSEDVSLFYELL